MKFIDKMKIEKENKRILQRCVPIDDLDMLDYEEYYDESDPEYYVGHPERKPDCCAPCGGPYPLCKDSCKLFD